MNRFALATLSALLLMMTATTALAAPFDELEGEWIGELPDMPPEIGEATIRLDFVSEDTVIVTMKFGEEKESMEMSYEATETEITVYEEGDAEGETAQWEINDDGELVISPDGEDSIVFTRVGGSDSDE